MKWHAAVAALVLLAAGSAGCGSSSGDGGGAPACSAASAVAATSVALQGTAFVPSCIKVPAGTTVTFSNVDAMSHTVTANDGTYDSGILAPTATFAHLYAAAGSYGVHCTIHAGMAATVIAQ